jgi:hypothetical protein
MASRRSGTYKVGLWLPDPLLKFDKRYDIAFANGVPTTVVTDRGEMLVQVFAEFQIPDLRGQTPR